MIRRFVPIFVVLLAIAGAAVAGESAPEGVVNVNTATSEQLQLLPGVGPALAERIVAFREANGPFRAADELEAVKGIGEKALERLRPYLRVSGETTLATKVATQRKPKA
jgi:competence protein ComEA